MKQRIVEFEPAYDKRDPDPNKNYGIHGVNLRMVLKGDRGAMQFLLYTNWHLPHVRQELARQDEPLPADVGYHSPTPMYEGQESITQACAYLDGRPCYYDGSGLDAQTVFDVLLQEGSEGVWRELEVRYVERFGPDEETA